MMRNKAPARLSPLGDCEHSAGDDQSRHEAKWRKNLGLSEYGLDAAPRAARNVRCTAGLSLVAGALGIDIPTEMTAKGNAAITGIIVEATKSSANGTLSNAQIQSLMSLVRNVRRLRRQYKPSRLGAA